MGDDFDGNLILGKFRKCAMKNKRWTSQGVKDFYLGRKNVLGDDDKMHTLPYTFYYGTRCVKSFREIGGRGSSYTHFLKSTTGKEKLADTMHFYTREELPGEAFRLRHRQSLRDLVFTKKALKQAVAKGGKVTFALGVCQKFTPTTKAHKNTAWIFEFYTANPKVLLEKFRQA